MAIEDKDDTGFRQAMRLRLGTMESMVLYRKEGGEEGQAHLSCA